MGGSARPEGGKEPFAGRRFSPRLRDGGVCANCGGCCERFAPTLLASVRDVARWRAEGRDDLLARMGVRGELWLNPATGERERVCPHLARAASGIANCLIHETKPEICRAYPGPIQGFRCLLGVRFPLPGFGRFPLA